MAGGFLQIVLPGLGMISRFLCYKQWTSPQTVKWKPPSCLFVSAEGRVYLALCDSRGIAAGHHHGGEHVSRQAGGAGAEAARSHLPPQTASREG